MAVLEEAGTNSGTAAVRFDLPGRPGGRSEAVHCPESARPVIPIMIGGEERPEGPLAERNRGLRLEDRSGVGVVWCGGLEAHLASPRAQVA